MNVSHMNRMGIPARRINRKGIAPRRTTLSILPMVATLMFAASGSVGRAAVSTATAHEPLIRNVRSGPVELIVSLDRATAQIAEQVKLTLTARAPTGVPITFPQNQSYLGSFNVLQVSDTPDIPITDGRQWTRQYQLESLVAGKQTIPPVSVAYLDGRQAKPLSDIVQSPPLELTITSVLEGTPDPLKFRDIKDVVELPVETHSSSAWIAWSLAGAAGLTLAGVALLVIPTRKRKMSAAQCALSDLERLEHDDLIATGQTQVFYFRLTDIVRQYIGRQCGIAAPKLTTAEFLAQATRHQSLDQPQQALLRVFLSLADLVKFARFEPGADDAQQAIAKARQFIEQTTAKEKV